MRIKAAKSLERLKQIKNKRRMYMTFADVDTDIWTECKVDSVYGSKYVKMIAWVNKNTDAFHSRSTESFWFEDKKDAFKFILKWGKTSE